MKARNNPAATYRATPKVLMRLKGARFFILLKPVNFKQV